MRVFSVEVMIVRFKCAELSSAAAMIAARFIGSNMELPALFSKAA
jgi:hypothetical protein